MITLITGILLGFLTTAVLALGGLVYVLLFVIYNSNNETIDNSLLKKLFKK